MLNQDTCQRLNQSINKVGELWGFYFPNTTNFTRVWIWLLCSFIKHVFELYFTFCLKHFNCSLIVHCCRHITEQTSTLCVKAHERRPHLSSVRSVHVVQSPSSCRWDEAVLRGASWITGARPRGCQQSAGSAHDGQTDRRWTRNQRVRNMFVFRVYLHWAVQHWAGSTGSLSQMFHVALWQVGSFSVLVQY